MKLLPSLKQLEYLVALVETVHFGKAAERCNVTPSTLSAGIRELESVLGVALAERTKRKVLITPLGRTIAERGRLMLGDAEEIMALAAARKAPLTGNLSLGVIPTIGPFLLPGALPGLRKTYPTLRLYLREEQTEPLLAKLRRGEIDAAIIALPYDTDGLTELPLFDDRFFAAVPGSHPFAERQRLTFDDLADAPLLLLEEGHCLRGHALAACGLEGRRRHAEFEATSLHTLVQMVAAGLGVTLLPKLAIDSGILAGTDIKLIEMDGAPSRQIGLVWRKSSLRVEEFRLLADEIARPHK